VGDLRLAPPVCPRLHHRHRHRHAGLRQGRCILLWGHNPSTSLLAAATRVAAARARGAKLIVVDPRHIGFAVKADCWLRVRPGTDVAVALALAGVMIERGWFDEDFVRGWTNGPFLVREDDGTLLRAEALAAGGEGFVAWDEGRHTAVRYDPTTREYELPPMRLALSGAFVVAGRDGPIACRTAFALYAAQCRAMSPETAAEISGVDADAIRERRECCGRIGRWRITPGPGSSSKQCDADGPGDRDPARTDRQHRRGGRQSSIGAGVGQRRLGQRIARGDSMVQGTRACRASARAGQVRLDSF
jgi:hypothetical protein